MKVLSVPVKPRHDYTCDICGAKWVNSSTMPSKWVGFTASIKGTIDDHTFLVHLCEECGRTIRIRERL